MCFAESGRKVQFYPIFWSCSGREGVWGRVEAWGGKRTDGEKIDLRKTTAKRKGMIKSKLSSQEKYEPSNEPLFEPVSVLYIYIDYRIKLPNDS